MELLGARRVVLALAFFGAAVGCKGKRDKSAADQGGTLTGSASAPSSATFSPLELPENTAFVVGFSFKQLQASKLWQKFGPVVKQSRQKELGELVTECGIDLLADLDSVIVAGDSTLDETTMLLAIKGAWDEDKANSCFSRMIEKQGKSLVIAKEDKLTRYAYQGESGNIYAYWTKNTLVVTPGLLTDQTRLREVASDSSKLADNRAMMDLLNSVDTGGTIWAAFLVPKTGRATAALGSEAGTPSSVSGTLRLSQTLDANVAIAFAEDQQAKDTVDRWTKKLERAKAEPTFGPIVAAVRLATDGKKAIVKAALDDKQMDQVIGFVDQQFGALLPQLLDTK